MVRMSLTKQGAKKDDSPGKTIELEVILTGARLHTAIGETVRVVGFRWKWCLKAPYQSPSVWDKIAAKRSTSAINS
jgi:hypothetical protein